MSYGKEYLRTEPLSSEDGITPKQMVKIWHLVKQNGISKQAFTDTLRSKFMVAKAGLLTKREAMMFIAQLSWMMPPIKADTSWIGPCPRYEQKGGE